METSSEEKEMCKRKNRAAMNPIDVRGSGGSQGGFLEHLQWQKREGNSCKYSVTELAPFPQVRGGRR